MTTNEIHERVNRRCGRKIPVKHLAVLMERFEELHGTPIDETNIGAFLRYVW